MPATPTASLKEQSVSTGGRACPILDLRDGLVRIARRKEERMSNGSEEMDARRKALADRIITDMVLDHKDAESIAKQKEANKQSLGHEGTANVEAH